MDFRSPNTFVWIDGHIMRIMEERIRDNVYNLVLVLRRGMEVLKHLCIATCIVPVQMEFEHVVDGDVDACCSTQAERLRNRKENENNLKTYYFSTCLYT